MLRGPERCSGTFIGSGIIWGGKVFTCIKGTCTGTDNGAPINEVIRQFDFRDGRTITMTNDTSQKQYFVYANCSGENLYGSSLNLEDGQIVPEGITRGDSRTYVLSRTP
jgi:hypothetical protein